MSERAPPKSPRNASGKDRLGAALRENLKRRKRQARGRAENRGEAAEPHDSAGIAADKENG
jgi:hypothetical protein